MVNCVHTNQKKHAHVLKKYGEDETFFIIFCMKINIVDFPSVLADLLRNPVYVSMVLGWMFGSYLIAGTS